MDEPMGTSQAPAATTSTEELKNPDPLVSSEDASIKQLQSGLMAFLSPITATIDNHVHAVQESQNILSSQIELLLGGNYFILII
jgi:hypothetical protein